ncbi:MAG: hypothetical protein QG608_1004 [Actinomycetota bacterium]|nr:hypothetical protein [Actinomycetota bacterium]
MAGCQSDGGGGAVSGTPTPGADEIAVERTIARSRALLDGLAAVHRSGARWTAAAERVTAGHRAQLLLLNVTQTAESPAPSEAGTPEGSASTPPQTTTAPGPTTPQELVTAQRDAAVEALVDLRTTSAPVAVKLSKIAGSRAVQADLLAKAAGLKAPGELPLPDAETTDPVSPQISSQARSDGTGTDASPTGTTAELPETTLKALSTLLAGEHAAVFAYGTITARIPSSSRARAQNLWNEHLRNREELIRRIRAGGGRPPAAEAAYGLGDEDLSTVSGVKALAATVEDGLASVAIEAVGQAEPVDRVRIAATLIGAARNSARWSGNPASLPG